MISNTSQYYDARLQKVNDLWLAGRDRRALCHIRKSKWRRLGRYAAKAIDVGLPVAIVSMAVVLFVVK